MTLATPKAALEVVVVGALPNAVAASSIEDDLDPVECLGGNKRFVPPHRLLMPWATKTTSAGYSSLPLRINLIGGYYVPEYFRYRQTLSTSSSGDGVGFILNDIQKVGERNR